MKKARNLLLLLLVCLTLSVPALAADSDFVIENGVLTKYTGSGGHVTIPNSVTTIGDYAFFECANVTRVTIPSSVTSIRRAAFGGCTGLTNISIPNSVTSIGDGAFEFCLNMSSIFIPESVTSMGGGIFYACQLTDVYYGGSAEAWIPLLLDSENLDLLHATNHFHATGPASVSQPPQEFYIDASNTLIRYAGTSSHVVIPDSVTSIGDAAFAYSKVERVTIPNSVTKIGDYAFAYCNQLIHFSVPNSITSIGKGAFSYCPRLTSVSLPNSITAIEYLTFGRSTNLCHVSIPNSVTQIEMYAFFDCYSLTDIYYSGNKAQWEAITTGNYNDSLRTATIHYDPTETLTDVSSTDWFADPVRWAMWNNITSGTSATTFGPNDKCTNAHILTFIWAAYGRETVSGYNPFTNVTESDYYFQPAVWAAIKGIIGGPTFMANQNCTRASAVRALWMAAGSPVSSTKVNFTDVPADAPYAMAVAWAVEKGITAGTSATTFGSSDTCTRAQIMTFLYKAMGN